MDSGAFWLLIVAVAIIGAPFLYVIILRWIWGPVRAHRRMGTSLQFDWQPTQIEHLSQEAREYFGKSVRQLREVGFEVISNCSRKAPLASIQRSVRVLMVHRETGDVASVVVIFYGASRKSIKVQSRSLN